jgi:hypothetical protein
MNAVIKTVACPVGALDATVQVATCTPFARTGLIVCLVPLGYVTVKFIASQPGATLTVWTCPG